MFEYLQGFSLFVDVVDADDSCRVAHIGSLEATKVLKALPSVYEFVGALLLRLLAFDPVVFGEARVVAQTDMRDESLLKTGRFSMDGLELLTHLPVQPAALLELDRKSPNIHPLQRGMDPSAGRLLHLPKRKRVYLSEIG